MGTNYNGAESIDYSSIQRGVPYPGATAKSGRWIAPATGTIAGVTALLNRVYADDFYLSKAMPLSQIACQVTSAGTAGALVRMGIYSDFDGMPDKLVAEATGTADATTLGVKTLNINTGILPAGRYWLAAVSQVAVCGLFSNSKNPDQHWAATAAVAIAYPEVGFVHDGVTDALPATFISAGSVDTAIRVAVRVA